MIDVEVHKGHYVGQEIGPSNFIDLLVIINFGSEVHKPMR